MAAAQKEVVRPIIANAKRCLAAPLCNERPENLKNALQKAERKATAEGQKCCKDFSERPYFRLQNAASEK